MFGRFQN